MKPPSGPKKQTQTNPISNPMPVFLRKSAWRLLTAESLGLLITQGIALLCEVLATQHEPRPPAFLLASATLVARRGSRRKQDGGLAIKFSSSESFGLLGAFTLNAGMVKLLKTQKTLISGLFLSQVGYVPA